MILLVALACSPDSVGFEDTAVGPSDSGDTDSGDTDSGDTDSGDTDDTEEPLPLADYDDGDGPRSVDEESDEVAGSDVVWFTPDGEPLGALVWSHGFARGAGNHASAARRAASWGFLVVTPSLPSFADHAANGEFLASDLVPEARERVGDAPVALVGHSAGGLASLLAAAEGSADLLVTLDGTDVGDLGVDAADDVEIPALVLAGEPSTCNASGSGRAWADDDRVLVGMPDASHCDFESDTDGLCERLCGDADPERQTLAQAVAVGWIAHAWGLGADAWVPGGAAWDAAVADGALEP